MFEAIRFLVCEVFVEVSYNYCYGSVKLVCLEVGDEVYYVLSAWIDVCEVTVFRDGSPLLHPGCLDSSCCQGFVVSSICVVDDQWIGFGVEFRAGPAAVWVA